MFQDTYYVPKRTGTYADVLTTYGLAALLERVFEQIKGPHGTWRIVLEDGGMHYLVRLSEPLQEEWLKKIAFFRAPAYYLTRDGQAKVPPGVDVRSVSQTWDQVRAYGEQRQALRDQGVKGTDLEQQLRDMEPPRDWAVVVFVGDTRMQAIGICNRVLEQWSKGRPLFANNLATILRLYASPSASPDDVLDEWAREARKAGMRVQETASQLLNPHQGKGLNEPKANALRMDNVKDRPWVEEFLKVIGLWYCMAPRQVIGTKDWKAYVLAPLRLSWRAHRQVFDRFNRYLWRERGQQTSLKTDITSVLLFTRAWLDYVEAAWRDELDVLADGDIVPERVVAGFHVAQFKLLSRNAYTMVNLSFLNLPAWSGELWTQVDVRALQGVIDEHLDVIRGIDEDRSDGFDLLRRYRDFVAGNKWDAFFDFAVGYSHEIVRRLNEGARWVPTFSPSRLGRLIMASNKPLLTIVRNVGFQNVAYAIRHSTVIPQGRKARNQDNLYEIRYGLGAELKRKATVRDEFIAALSDFMHSYNRENAQVLESRNQQMRRDLRTSDIDEVVRLVDEYGSEVVANLLVAYGYAREPREGEES